LVHRLLSDLVNLNSPLVVHVVLTHNSSDDRSEFTDSLKHAVKQLRLTQIVNVSPRGFGANHNAAFAICTEPFFAVLNPDLHLPSDPFGKLIDAFGDIQCGLVAPRVLATDGSLEDSARALYTPFSLLGKVNQRSRFSNNPAWFAGMFLLFRKESFAAIKGFDEKFFMYVEDVDVCARLAIAGWSLSYVSQAFVIHDARRANRKSFTHLKWHISSALKWWCSDAFWRYKKLLASRR
jgi:N-acetylglucosaminyl-diphospho-decaprenol L-rhamnosyltransferase